MSTLEVLRNLSQRSPREAKKSLWQSLSPDFTNQLSPAHLPDTCLGAATSCACLSQSDSFASPLAAGSDLPATKKSKGFFMLFWLFSVHHSHPCLYMGCYSLIIPNFTLDLAAQHIFVQQRSGNNQTVTTQPPVDHPAKWANEAALAPSRTQLLRTLPWSDETKEDVQ